MSPIRCQLNGIVQNQKGLPSRSHGAALGAKSHGRGRGHGARHRGATRSSARNEALRAVLDPNVVISAPLSPGGSPSRLFRYWLEGDYDVVVSPKLSDELDGALEYAKLKDRVHSHEKKELLDRLFRGGIAVQDPQMSPEMRSPDPHNDYLIALASISRSVLVSGDKDLLGLSHQIPVYTPAEFLGLIEASS